jgi:hypothetical protein
VPFSVARALPVAAYGAFSGSGTPGPSPAMCGGTGADFIEGHGTGPVPVYREDFKR